MTFSDSRIVEALKRDWNPVWESVSPVKEVTFELGEGREVRGTVGGEIAIYFCDEKGQVFDIFPALQSPAATLDAIQDAYAFYKSQKGVMSRDTVRAHHLAKMREVLEFRVEGADWLSADDVTAGIELDFNLNPREEAAVEEMRLIEGKDLFPEAAKNEAEREMKIDAGLDAATRDMREMTGSKVSFASLLSEEPITVVEPGGRGYYRWQVRRAFCGINPEKGEGTEATGGWDASLKSPNEWKLPLFEHILRQPLGGGKFKYNSESLEALSIIED